MKKDPTLIKQDINFLEYPLWFQGKHNNSNQEDRLLWEDREGFFFRSGYKPPVKTDAIILFYLLGRSQKAGWSKHVEVSRYELLLACGFTNTKYWYERLLDSLERWKMVGIKFEGKFYNGEEYTSMNFGIIDSWKLREEDNRLEVRLSEEWLLKVKHSTFFKLIDFEQMKALRSPLATRLYEILVKTFQGRTRWDIGAKKLAEKIPMKEIHPAHIIPKIKAAVNRINEKTELSISLQIEREGRGKALFIFRAPKEEKKKPSKKEASLVLDLSDGLKMSFFLLVDLLPKTKKHSKTILDTLQESLRKHDESYVRQNILYTNKNAKKNYRNLLIKALKENYGEGFEEKEAAKEKQKEETKKRTVQEREKEVEVTKQSKKETTQQQLVTAWLHSMEEGEKEAFYSKIKESLLIQTPSLQKLPPKVLKSMIALQVRVSLLERIKKLSLD